MRVAIYTSNTCLKVGRFNEFHSFIEAVDSSDRKTISKFTDMVNRLANSYQWSRLEFANGYVYDRNLKTFINDSIT